MNGTILEGLKQTCSGLVTTGKGVVSLFRKEEPAQVKEQPKENRIVALGKAVVRAANRKIDEFIESIDD